MKICEKVIAKGLRDQAIIKEQFIEKVIARKHS